MVKVVFVLPTIGFGGAEKVYIDIASYLNETTNNDITLLYLTETQNQRNIPSDLKVVCLNVPNVRSGVLKLNGFFKKEKPDVVFSSIAHLNIIMSLIKIMFSHKFKLYLRQTNILSSQAFNRFSKKITLKVFDYFYNKADAVIFQSQYMKDDFNKLVPIQTSKVINNPVQSNVLMRQQSYRKNDFNIDKNKINIIFIGRLVKVKNVEYIINMFAKSDSISSLHLYIIGDGPEKHRLIKLARELAMNDKITFLGQQNNPYQYLKQMDLLVNASLSEGFPNVLLEALSLNIPIVVRKHPGGTEELMKELGLGVYFVENLKFSGIDEILKYYPKELSVKAQEQYGIEKVSKEYLECIIQNSVY